MALLHLEEYLSFTERSYYPRKLVPENARGQGRPGPTRGSRAGPTTHPHSRIKHKCHLPMLDPHEPRASLTDPSPPQVSSLLIPWLPLLPDSVTFRSFFARGGSREKRGIVVQRGEQPSAGSSSVSVKFIYARENEPRDSQQE